MGQQQLLLLVIGVVLVGLAVVATFTVLERNYDQDEADGLLDRALAISTDAVAWKSKMDPFAGGNQSYARLAQDGLQTLAVDTATVRGRFAITAATASTVEITGVSDRRPGIGVRVTVRDYDVESSEVSFDGGIGL